MTRKPDLRTLIEGSITGEEEIALSKVAALIVSLREIEGITVDVDITVTIRTVKEGKDAP